ncbi:hypothetical protein K8B33_04250 [Alcanivorax sp. JB21]|nr:hypothetical protein [Alcanivorax limicola]
MASWLLLSASAHGDMGSGVDTAERAHVWHLITDRDNIQVFLRKHEDSRMRSFRGVMVMPVEDFSAIGAQLNDYAFIASWMHMVSEITEIRRRTAQDRDVHVTTFLPWPVSNRDVALLIRLHQSADDHTVNVRYRALEGDMPLVPGYVRMPEMTGHLRFEPLEAPDVRVTFEVVVDPGGFIPAWLGNLILRDIPYFSLQRLSRMINQPAYQWQDNGLVTAPPAWPAAQGQAARPDP